VSNWIQLAYWRALVTTEIDLGFVSVVKIVDKLSDNQLINKYIVPRVTSA
jgi:hypothetical protein